MPIKKSLEIYLMILVSKVPTLKMSGNLFYDTRINVPILKKSGNLFNDTRINVPILKKSGNLFKDPRIFAHRKKSLETFNDPSFNAPI